MGLIIRELVSQDLDAVREMLKDCGAFSSEEVSVALELLNAGLSSGLEGDYPLLAAELDGRVSGYACIGRTPMTQSTWHLYWLCVHPHAQRRGVARTLQAYMEKFIAMRGGERIVAETGGRADYEPARRFYEGAGYRSAGRIGDYYKLGDDCVFYCKVLG